MNFILAAAFLFVLGAAAGIALGRWPAASRLAGYGSAALASLSLLLESLACLLGGASSSLILPGTAALADFSFRLTPFGALFCAPISALGFAASVYAVGYAEEHDDKVSRLVAFYNLFLLGMSFLPAAQNAFSFLLCWEWMTVASFFLVALDHEKSESRRAGYIYFVMSQAGAAFVFALFFLLRAAAGSWEFEAFKAAGPLLPAGAKNALFLLALIGFGTKAGMAPLHLWLPYAHPAAPSHVSALMSGAMIKTGIYGLLLTIFSFLGGGPWWWGAVLLAAAAATSLIGVAYALIENDIKRLLAYCSVENIGVILMGVGAGMLFRAFGREELALLSLSAALYHTVNHALFKGLLFLSAGSVLKAAHTRNIEEMGGLIKRMPLTALCFLIGSMSISALPPFNGFVSEWLTFQALLSGFNLPTMSTRILSLLAAAALALTSGLAAACFVKAFGVAFLALPRIDNARRAVEASVWELSAMGILALGCLGLGLFPGVVLGLLKPAIESLNSGPAAFLPNPLLAPSAADGPYGQALPAARVALTASAAAAAAAAARWIGGPARARRVPTWACGLPELTPRMEYTATAFSKPFRLLFSFIYRPLREVSQECVSSPYFPRNIRYSSKITYLIREKLYRPPLRLFLKVSHMARRLQAGSVNVYLGYLSAAVTALLLLSLWGGWR